jgi:succinyl-diaminopimelate desuccinylase
MTEKMRDSFYKDLLGLISIRSFTRDYNGIKQCFDYIASIADRFGFCSRICAKGMVLEVYPKDMPFIPKIGIVTHVDTVPFDEKNWNYNPLGEIAENRVYGRGVIDDKVGVIYSLYAFKELERKIKPDWKIIVGSSEEESWNDISTYIREGNTIPGFIITIDGDGIQNGCRGILNLDMAFEKSIPEPTIKDFKTPNGVTNIVPDCVDIQIGHSFQKIMGKAAHSSIPEKGSNAISNTFWKHEQLFKEEYSGFAFFMAINELCGNAFFIPDGSRTIKGQDVPKTIATPTMVRMVNDKILLEMNIRLSPTITSRRDIYAAISKTREIYNCIIFVKELMLPSFIPKENKELILMQKAYEKVSGYVPKVRIALGSGYNAAFPNACIFGPRFDEEEEFESDLCHCPDESRNMDDIDKFYEILRTYLEMSLR